MDESKENIIEPENFETIPVPKIEVKREPGMELLAEFLSKLKQPPEDNDEALEMIALTYSHPECKDEIINQIKKYKPFIQNPEQLYEKTMNSLRDYEKNAPLSNIDEEIQMREKNIPTYKERIKKSVEYFRPNPKTSNIKNVEIIICDNLLSSKYTGRAFHVGNSIFIRSYSLNLDNFDHEFLHSIINPITENFTNYFEGDEQKQKILSLVDDKLKKSDGDYPMTILNDELINTYNIYIKNGGKMDTLLDFQNKLNNATEEDFKKDVENNSNLRKLLKKLDINNLNDLRAKSEIFYERSVKELPKIKNELRKRLLGFYKKYESEKKSDTSLSFEKYFSENFKKILD